MGHRHSPVSRFTLRACIPVLFACCALSEDFPDMLSHIPSDGVEQFIVDRLDLTTFRNSLGPARSPGIRYFSQMGIEPTEISPGHIVLETEDWYYAIDIVERMDVNHDGLEDLLIRFTDDSKEGTYLTNRLYLLTCFSEGSDLLAIAFGPPDYLWEPDLGY